MQATLYSFRRCPYAMRARLAIYHAGLQVELREILLKNKPSSMLDASPKGTVPVLVLSQKADNACTHVIDESLDIMYWAYSQQDPDQIMVFSDEELKRKSEELIHYNDNAFKPCLDRYKYFERFTDEPQTTYREQCEEFFKILDSQLSEHEYLLGAHAKISDLAIFPFIRQCAHVDLEWFYQTPYKGLQRWLDHWLSSRLFADIMQKNVVWEPGQPGIKFGQSKPSKSFC